MIIELKNPKTEDYLTFKKEVLSNTFPWYWNENSVDVDILKEKGELKKIPFLGHSILKRPCDPGDYRIYPNPNSSFSDLSNIILNQIFYINGINFNCVLRINLNLTIPVLGIESTKPHIDHEFPHKNMLIYLNKSDGDTILCDDNNVKNDNFTPKEDSIILFEGRHYHNLPKEGRRVVLICTFI